VTGIRVPKAQDRGLVLELVRAFLEEGRKNGSDVLPTPGTVAFFMGIYDSVLSGARGGVVLLEGEVGLHMAADAELPYETAHGRTALGWVTYVRPGARKQKIATRLREAGFELLRRQGFDSAIGAVELVNQEGVTSAERAGFEAYQVLLLKRLEGN